MTDRPVTPRPASTVLVARDGAAGIEVLLIRRNVASDFAAGALVFPGGALHAEDGTDAMRARCRGPVAPAVLPLAVAAIRETFEEAGILLACRTGVAAPVGGADHRDLVARYQHAVAARETGWIEMLDREDLTLACDLVVPFAHWITPPSRPKRFDTHFFVAPAPAGQEATHDAQEAVDAVWLRPADAIAG